VEGRAGYLVKKKFLTSIIDNYRLEKYVIGLHASRLKIYLTISGVLSNIKQTPDAKE
jgi:hypothetical protein